MNQEITLGDADAHALRAQQWHLIAETYVKLAELHAADEVDVDSCKDVVQRIRREAEEGSDVAKLVWADILRMGSFHQARDEVTALDLLEPLAEQPVSSPAALLRLHDLYTNAKQARKAFECAQRCAHHGNDEGMVLLAHALRDGDGVEQDHLSASRWYYRAMQQHHPLGTAGYAIALRDGLGLTPNVPEAIRLLESLANNSKVNQVWRLENLASAHRQCGDAQGEKSALIAAKALGSSSAASRLDAADYREKSAEASQFTMYGKQMKFFVLTVTVDENVREKSSHTYGSQGYVNTSHSVSCSIKGRFADGSLATLWVPKSAQLISGNDYQVIYLCRKDDTTGSPCRLYDQLHDRWETISTLSELQKKFALGNSAVPAIIGILILLFSLVAGSMLLGLTGALAVVYAIYLAMKGSNQYERALSRLQAVERDRVRQTMRK